MNPNQQTALQDQAVQKLALQVAQLSYDKALAESRAEAAEDEVRRLQAGAHHSEEPERGTAE